MQSLTLQPIRHAQGTVRLPGSKSISNRALLLAALANGDTRISNLLRSDDTNYMLRALRQLGVTVREHGDDWVVKGHGGPLIRTNEQVELQLGMAGTAYRPLVAALCLGQGDFSLQGNARMRERPIGHLVDALRELGADIRYLENDGFPPVAVRGTGLTGGQTRIAGNISSQFLTALLMALPLADKPTRVEIIGELVSKPYIDITLNLMARFGVEVSHQDYQVFDVPVSPYQSPGRFLVEGDASSASYFLAAGAISGPVRVEGLGRDSIQGDTAFVEVLQAMGAKIDVGEDYIEVASGALKGVDLDLNAIPDAAMTLAVLALFAEGPTRIRNIYNWRVKETDRLHAMATELRKLGATVEEGRDYLVIEPPTELQPAEIETYDDHRVAMCFSLAALGGVPVTILDPGCVAKTFPDYFERFAEICA